METTVNVGAHTHVLRFAGLTQSIMSCIKGVGPDFPSHYWFNIRCCVMLRSSPDVENSCDQLSVLRHCEGSRGTDENFGWYPRTQSLPFIYVVLAVNLVNCGGTCLNIRCASCVRGLGLLIGT